MQKTFKIALEGTEFSEDIVTFTEEILNGGKPHFLCSGKEILTYLNRKFFRYVLSQASMMTELLAETVDGFSSLAIFIKKLHHLCLTES